MRFLNAREWKQVPYDDTHAALAEVAGIIKG